MKKFLVLCSILAVMAAAGVVSADCGGCGSGDAKDASKTAGVKPCCAKAAGSTACNHKAGAEVKQAAGGLASCPLSAAKAAYDKSLSESGCAKTADAASKRAMAETAYSKALAATGCEKTAAKAAYQTVLDHAKCEASAQAAYKHAVAKAAYDKSLESTGCAKTAQAAYDKAAKSAGEFKVASKESSDSAS